MNLYTNPLNVCLLSFRYGIGCQRISFWLSERNVCVGMEIRLSQRSNGSQIRNVFHQMMLIFVSWKTDCLTSTSKQMNIYAKTDKLPDNSANKINELSTGFGSDSNRTYAAWKRISTAFFCAVLRLKNYMKPIFEPAVN